jgi:hypothetical protein
MVVYLISQPGVSMWLPSYWISQAGVEEPKPHFIPAWPHKHPINSDETVLHISYHDEDHFS